MEKRVSDVVDELVNNNDRFIDARQ